MEQEVQLTRATQANQGGGGKERTFGCIVHLLSVVMFFNMGATVLFRGKPSNSSENSSVLQPRMQLQTCVSTIDVSIEYLRTALVPLFRQYLLQLTLNSNQSYQFTLQFLTPRTTHFLSFLEHRDSRICCLQMLSPPKNSWCSNSS